MNEFEVIYYQDEEHTVGPYSQTFATQERADAFRATVYAVEPDRDDDVSAVEDGETVKLSDEADYSDGVTDEELGFDDSDHTITTGDSGEVVGDVENQPTEQVTTTDDYPIAGRDVNSNDPYKGQDLS